MADSEAIIQSPQRITHDDESPSTAAPTHEDPRSGSPSSSHSTTNLQELSARILQAIEDLDMKKLHHLGSDQMRFSKQWYMKDEDIPLGYQSFPDGVLECFSFSLDKSYEDRILAAASVKTEGDLPVHRWFEWVNTPEEDTSTRRVIGPISILGGFHNKSTSEHWRVLDKNGKNALHIAASGRDRNSDYALRTLLGLIAMSWPRGRIVGLDDKTERREDTIPQGVAIPEESTALQLAASNSTSENAFQRLLYAGANPWIQNSSGETILHCLVRLSDIKDRISKARMVLNKTGNWTPHLVAVSHDETAMSLALSKKDYEMVTVLATASQTPSFVLEGEDAKRWVKDGTRAFTEAVSNLDADLDPVRDRLIRNLAEDGSLKDCFTQKDDSGLTALHKACDLTEDRSDIVKALLSGANIHERAGRPGDARRKTGQRFDNWSALTFATRRGHGSTTLVLLEQGISNDLTSGEWSEIIQFAYDQSDLYIASLVQHFRTHDSVILRQTLEIDHEVNMGEQLMLSALKWPRKEMKPPDIEMERSRQLFQYQTETWKDFDHCSYPERRLIHHLVYSHEGPLWSTWTKKNGGWIHLPANNLKWIENICRASYKNEEKFPEWLHSHRALSDRSDYRQGAVRRILENTYMNEEEFKLAFPQIERVMQSQTPFQGLEDLLYPDFSRDPPLPTTTSQYSVRRHWQLSIECQKALAFIQDSLREIQQHGATHRQVRQGFKSLFVQRQELLDQPNAPDVPGAEPKPRPAVLERKYALKSVILPVLDVDWMLSYLEVSDHESQGPTQPSGASGPSDLADEQTHFTRSVESKAIVKEDLHVKPDRREEGHWEQMKKLYHTFKEEIRKPLSLDQYFYHDLNDNEVQERISSQVVSRFIYHQHESHRSRMKCSSGRAAEPLRNFPQCHRGEPRSSSQYLDPARDLERGPDVEFREVDSPRQQILIVPQLWLFKIDNTVVSSYPDRWDRSNLGSSLLSSMSKQVQAQPRSIEADKLLHKLLECAMHYDPAFPLCGERYTHEEAFSGEISRLSRKIEQSYGKFHEYIGRRSYDAYLDAFRTVTYCHRTIDDVLRELSMIKRVYQDQTRVWEDFHNAASLSRDPPSDGLQCPYSDLCDPKVLPQRLFTRVSNLVDEANIVQESAVTLLTLLQGEASAGISARSFEQSKFLGIFTVVTVIFAPLSWIAAVFALEVQDTTWTWLNVLGGSFGSVMITLLFCALGWLWLSWRDKTKRYEEGLDAAG